MKHNTSIRMLIKAFCCFRSTNPIELFCWSMQSEDIIMRPLVFDIVSLVNSKSFGNVLSLLCVRSTEENRRESYNLSRWTATRKIFMTFQDRFTFFYEYQEVMYQRMMIFHLK